MTTQEGLPALATDEDIAELRNYIEGATEPFRGNGKYLFASGLSRVLARLEAAERQVKELTEALAISRSKLRPALRRRRGGGQADDGRLVGFAVWKAAPAPRASAEPAVAVAQWQRYANLIERKWINIEPDEIEKWKRLGYPVRALYAAPPPSPVVSEAMIDCGMRGWVPGEQDPRKVVTAILTAALSHAPAGEVGWRTVPRKLTPVMIHAYCEKANSLGFHAFMNASCAWETLLAAAPLPASPTGGDK